MVLTHDGMQCHRPAPALSARLGRYGGRTTDRKGRQVQKIKKSLLGWKPLGYSLATMAIVALAAGAKWRPR